MTDKIPTPKPDVHDYVTVRAGARLIIGVVTDPDEGTGVDVEVILTKPITVCLADHIPQKDFVVIGMEPIDD